MSYHLYRDPFSRRQRIEIDMPVGADMIVVFADIHQHVPVWIGLPHHLTVEQAQLLLDQHGGSGLTIVPYRNAHKVKLTRSAIEAMDGGVDTSIVRSAPPPGSHVHGPYGWLIKPIGLAEDAWYLSNDPSEHPAEEISVPLFAREEQALGSQPPAPQITGALAAIAAERQRQIAKGYDAVHDDGHISGEIIKAEWGALARIQDALHAGRCGSVEGYQKSLIQAAAQIAAEYERVARAALASEGRAE